MDDQPYLAPGFDPNTLVIPRLRSILLAHNVNYPSSAKKSQLVDLFNEQVVPQARSLRAANAKVRRTSRGIVDIDSGRKGVGQGDSDSDDEPEPPRTASKSARRSTRARTEEVEEPTPVSRSTRHSTAPPEHTPRRASSKRARASDGNETGSTKRRVSRGVRTPKVKSESEDEPSPFSNDNVFQSGSPPSDRPASRSTDRRRSAGRRQTGGAVVPARKTFEVSDMQQDDVEPSEEFTPDEQQELIKLEKSGEVVPVARKNKKPPGSVSRVAPWAVSLAILAGIGGVWRQEKLNVGYCGVGHPSYELAGVEIPPWAEPIRPQCEPCPQHAYCGELLETSCEPDFVLTPHPLSFGGAVPLAPTCEPDSAKARRVNFVRERAVEELRQQNAKYECGEAPSPVIKEPELKRTMAAKRRKGMSQDEFDDLWASAIGDIQSAEEIVVDNREGSSTLRSTSLARLPISCAIRRSLRATLREYVWQLIGLMVLAFSGLYTQKRITSGRTTDSQAKKLARLALDKLSQQASLHAADPNAFREPYISVAQLRDDVLRDEFRPDRRRQLWDVVQRKVEANSNVRPMVREGRSGDVGRVWEWVGAVSMIESPPATGKKRVSWGVSTDDKGVKEELVDQGQEMIKREDNGHVGKWNEGGQYF